VRVRSFSRSSFDDFVYTFSPKKQNEGFAPVGVEQTK
jgi:hypothetical protein